MKKILKRRLPRGEYVAKRTDKLARCGFVLSRKRIQERSESLEDVPVTATARIVLFKKKKIIIVRIKLSAKEINTRLLVREPKVYDTLPIRYSFHRIQD